MIRLKRPELLDSVPARTKGQRGGPQKRPKDRLETRQKSLNQKLAKETDEKKRRNIIKQRWDDFRKEDRHHSESVFKLASEMSNGKCAYCEYGEADETDHYFPKAQFPEKMFDWENMLPACSSCNKTYKGDKLEWVDDSGHKKSKWLDPSNSSDEPLLFFQFNPRGWVDPKAGLSDAQCARAEYTVSELGLNTRSALLHHRKLVIQRFSELCESLEDGPDVVAGGKTIGESFVEFLSRKTACLGPIRQILREKPALRKELILAVPGLQAELEAWDVDAGR